MKLNRKLYILILTFIAGMIYIANDVDQSSFAKRLLSTTLDINKIQTNPNRLSSVQKFCKGTTRADLITDSDQATNKQYFSIMKTYFNKELIPLFKLAVNNQTDKLIQQAKQLIPGFAVYVAPFIIGFVLALTIWTCLCCCCVCPTCCPSKCCRNNDNLLYTKCQLVWPAVFLLLMLILAIAAGIPGLTQAGKLSSSFETMQCGIVLGMDDVINGNITVDQTAFFFGINTLSNILTKIRGRISDISGNFSSVQSSITSIVSDSSTVMNQLQDLAVPSSPNTSSSISYNAPLPGSSSSLNSLFNPFLGNPSVSSSFLGGVYKGFQTLHDNMDQVKTNLDNVMPALTGSDFNNAIGTALDTFKGVSDSVSGYTGMADTYLSMATPYLGYVKLGVLIFFAVSIGLSVFALIGLVLTAFFDKPRCRYLMYITCVFMVLIVILGFLITLIFSFLTPLFYMTCSTLNPIVDSQQGFINFTQTVGLGGQPMAQMVSVCFSGGNGQILTALNITALNNLNSQLGNITSIMSGFQAYLNYPNNALTTVDSQIVSQLTSWRDGQYNDLLGDAQAANYLKNLANRTYVCSDPNFDLDSLVTSTSPKSTDSIPCHVSGIIKCDSGTHQTFSTLGAVNGCIDMVSCFQRYTANSAAVGVVKSDINSRYSGCSPNLGDRIQDLYQKWDKVRRPSINSILNDYTSNIQSDVNNLQTSMNSISTNFNTIYNNLNTTVSEIVDPQYGLTSGLNCRVIGQDIVNAKDTICVSLFNSFFFLMVTVGITSFAFLFSLCCIVCNGVRRYKQSCLKTRIITVQNDPFDQTFVHLQEKKDHYP